MPNPTPLVRGSLASLSVLATLSLSVVVSAQPVKPVPQPEPSEARKAVPIAPSSRTEKNAQGEEQVVLSPFVVNSDQDHGYAGTSTLAGTRLNTPINDLGSAVSIYTKQFLEDIGATSNNDLLIYATGMEAGGAGGNFSGAAGNDIANPSVQSDASRNEPQSVTRARGLASPNNTRNFFTTDIANDAYITESVTVNRGPNAILFGVGSPAGVVESGVLRADPSRNRNKVQFRYGDDDSTRSNVDFNRVIIPNKVAIRVAALDDDDRPPQRPAFEHKRRIFGATTVKPFKSMSFYGNFESGGSKSNRPFTGLPFNSISDQWIAAGKPTYDWTFFDDPARNPRAATMDPSAANLPSYVAQGLISPYIGQGQIFGGTIQVYNNANSQAPGLGFQATGPATTTSNAANAVRNNVFDPVFNRDTSFDTVWFIDSYNKAEIPAFAYADGLQPAGIKFQGFTDYNAFDWRNRQIDETGRQSESFNTVNLNLEQRFWSDRIGVELAYFHQRYELRNLNPFFSTGGNGNHIRVDPNVSLPTGQPNPNLGRPFAIFGQTANGNSFRERQSERVTAFFRYDFKDLSPTWGKWIGRHTITGLGEKVSADILNFSTRLTNSTGDTAGTGVPPIGFNNRPILLVYMGPSILNGAPLRLNPIQIPRPLNGFTTFTSSPVAAAGDPAQATYGTTKNVFVEILNGANVSREVIKSKAGVMQSYWLDDLVVTTVGWRRDEDYLTRPAITVTAASPLAFGIDQFHLPSLPPPTVSNEVKSFSGVLRWPHKLVKLPQGMNASFFTNYSGNFTPLGSRVDYENNSLPSPTGTTREFGMNVSFFNEKLTLRYNHFETRVKNGTGNSSVLGTLQNNAINQFIPQQVALANTTGQDFKPLLQRVLDAIPGFVKAYQVSLTGSASNATLNYSFVSLSGLGDTADSVAKGNELELVFNPTRQWRLLANVAQQETVQSNISPVTRRLMNALLPVWNSPDFAAMPRSDGTTSLSYLTNLSIIPYQNLLATEGLASAEQRKYRANLVTNYTFAQGRWLKGFGIGTGVRWQDKIGIGYPTTRDPVTRIVKIDIAHAYYAPAETNVDAFASYSRKLWRDSIDWKLQLNVTNVVGSSTLIAINAQPDGSIASYRLPPARRWYVTNSFNF